MGTRTISLLLLAAAAIFAGPASAIVCYTVMDKSDQVVYRGYEAPVDLSMTPVAAAAREAMRQRGEYMMISDSEDCLLVGSSRWASTGAAGYATATVDEIVLGIRPLASGAPSGTPTSVSSARANAPAARPTSSSASSTRRGY